MQKQENPFLNIIFNIVLPILILNKGGKYIGPEIAVVIALSFPVAYAVWDRIKFKKWNAISVLGFFNILMTGTLALKGLDGVWFSIKEAAFPLLVGVFVAGSAFTTKPFLQTLLINPQLMQVELIETRLVEHKAEESFKRLVKKLTVWLSFSFLMSSIVNFALAQRIFTPIATEIIGSARQEAINSQLAEMTKWSMLVLMIPSVLFMLGIFFYFIRQLQNMTGLSQDEILKDA